jgi:hypothetical protein
MRNQVKFIISLVYLNYKVNNICNNLKLNIKYMILKILKMESYNKFMINYVNKKIIINYI